MSAERVSAVGLRHFRCFVTVAEAGSFAAAAARLNLSPSALTATIKAIEAETGVLLFDRTTRQVALTRHGAEFLPQARRLLRDAGAAMEGLRVAGGLQSGAVSIAAAPSIVTCLMPEVVRAFHAGHPAVRVELRDDGAEGIARRVAEGEADFGIGSLWAENKELSFRPLFRDRFGVVCLPGDPLITLARTRGVHWAALIHRRLVGLAEDTGIRALLARAHGLPGSAEAPALTASNTLGLLTMVRAGLGLAVMPEFAGRLPGGEGLQFLPLMRPAVWREVCLITRRDRSPTPAARAFLDAILARLHAMSPLAGVKLAQ